MAITSFRGDFAFLSNFYMKSFWGSPFRELEHGEKLVVLFRSGEHCFQASKAQSLTDMYWIAAKQTPSEAKKAGRATALRSDWESVKVDVMRHTLGLKFNDPEMSNLLVATGDEELSEGNHWGDTFWGVSNGRGKNMLGILLMELREVLSESAAR